MGIQTKRSQLAGRGGSGGEASRGDNRPFEAQYEPCHCRYPLLESPRSLTAINATNLCIVPVRPATFDIWASEVTGRKLTWARSLFFCSINVRPPANVGKASPRLKPLVPFYGPTLQRGPTFSKPGKGVTEVDPKGAAAQEMRDLWMDLSRRLRPIQTCEK
jgi:chromosome partitioning protein